MESAAQAQNDTKHANAGAEPEEENDDTNLSPRSQEQLLNINSGIYQLVDDVLPPHQSREDLETRMNNLRINNHLTGQPDEGQEDSIFNNQGFVMNLQSQNSHLSNDLASLTPMPGFNMNADAFQKQGSDITEIHNVYVGDRRSMSRHSSEGENGLMVMRNNSGNEGSDYAMGGLSNSQQLDDRYSMRSYFEHNSDYQDQLDKYGYIFQSPEVPSQHPTNGGYYQPRNMYQPAYAGLGGGGHQHNQRAVQGPQMRANSFDKLAKSGEGASTSQALKNPLVANNEDIETHSAISGGSHSAFSEGDLHQYPQFAPTFHGYHQFHPGYYGGPNYNGVYSNQASYNGGFTPQVQFTGSSQKQNPNGLPQMMGDGIPFYFNSDDVNEDSNAQIQLTGQDVSLMKNSIGISPSRHLGDQKGAQFKSSQGGFLGQQEQMDTQAFGHGHFKTPSPFRNSDIGQKTANLNVQGQTLNNSGGQQRRAGGGHSGGMKSDPFYPTSIQNQKTLQNQYPKGIYQPSRSSLADQYQGSMGLGINAPPMTRGIDFSHNDANNIMAIHGPLLAFQKQMHPSMQPPQQYGIQGNFMPQQVYAHHHFMPHHPGGHHPHHQVRHHGVFKQTNSQERDASYQAPNFIPAQMGPYSKSGVNTPTHNDPNLSVSSVNSNNSQKFGSLTVEPNSEALFHSLIKQFDECQALPQKFDIIRGTVHKMAFTQTGSRFLQKQLTKANSSIVAFFLEEIGPHLSELMVDNYGNYFCQRLLSSCSGEQRMSILKSIQSKFIEICCNRKGTHTIQTMFELVNLPEEEDFIKEALTGNIIRLAKDSQGTHVVQKVMQSFEESKRQFIFDEVFSHFIELAKNTNGLCVIKKLVSCTSSQDQAKKLLQKMSENVIDLVQDPYGNYAVTEVINNWDPELCKPIFMILKTRISQLSNQKFSSNVIERCLEQADAKTRSLFIEEICNSDKLTSLVRNSYGNYVVQKALKIAVGKDKTNLIQAIQRCIPEISDKKIRSKWETILEEAQGQTEGLEEGAPKQVALSKRNSSDSSK